MKRLGTLLAACAALSGAACTIVAPDGPDAGPPKVKTVLVPFPVSKPQTLPPPQPLEASVLFVANLQKSSANLASQYASIITGLAATWQTAGLQIDNMGLISTYADQYGPRLLLGRSASAGPPTSSLTLLAALAAASDAGVTDYASLLAALGPSLSNIDDTDPMTVATALQILASTGSFDGDGQTSEGKNLIEFGQGLNAAALPPELGGVDRSAFFAVPHDLFIVVYLQPLARRCAMGSSDCNVNGRSPTDIFLDTNADGTASWLTFLSGGIRPEQIVHVAAATAEGQSEDDFVAACKALPGFPPNLLDVMAPSPNAYFGPLSTALNAAHPGTGQTADFCALIDAKSSVNIATLGANVAGLATSH